MQSSDRARRLREAAAEAEAQAMSRVESGELRHLHGQPLDLSDDSPTWFVNKLLKREGFSHPLIERGRELDVVQRDADTVRGDLLRRYERLIDPAARPTAEQISTFNEGREDALRDYGDALRSLNRAIMFHNLAVPETLHRRPVLIDDAVAQLAEEVPALEPLPAGARPGFWKRLLRGRQR